jgi:CRP-like cAMP-binding protein
VWCCAVPRAEMRELLLASPGLSLALLRMTHKGLDDLRSRFADVTSPAEQRVARFLVGTLKDWKSNVPGFTQMDIARAVGLTPETLCRVLAQFRQRQWIDGRARGLTVTDAVPLMRLAHNRDGD